MQHRTSLSCFRFPLNFIASTTGAAASFCLSQDEKCLLRTFCSRYHITILFNFFFWRSSFWTISLEYNETRDISFSDFSSCRKYKVSRVLSCGSFRMTTKVWSQFAVKACKLSWWISFFQTQKDWRQTCQYRWFSIRSVVTEEIFCFSRRILFDVDTLLEDSVEDFLDPTDKLGMKEREVVFNLVCNPHGRVHRTSRSLVVSILLIGIMTYTSLQAPVDTSLRQFILRMKNAKWFGILFVRPPSGRRGHVGKERIWKFRTRRISANSLSGWRWGVKKKGRGSVCKLISLSIYGIERRLYRVKAESSKKKGFPLTTNK